MIRTNTKILLLALKHLGMPRNEAVPLLSILNDKEEETLIDMIEERIKERAELPTVQEIMQKVSEILPTTR